MKLENSVYGSLVMGAYYISSVFIGANCFLILKAFLLKESGYLEIIVKLVVSTLVLFATIFLISGNYKSNIKMAVAWILNIFFLTAGCFGLYGLLAPLWGAHSVFGNFISLLCVLVGLPIASLLKKYIETNKEI